MYKIICDKCSKESETQKDTYTPKEWDRIHLHVYGGGNREYHVCPDCSKELDINGASHTAYGTSMSIEDRLIRILAEFTAAHTDG